MALPIYVKTTHTVEVSTEIWLPDDRAWAHVKEWDISENALNVTWEDGTKQSFDLNSIKTGDIGETPNTVDITQAEMALDQRLMYEV